MDAKWWLSLRSLKLESSNVPVENHYAWPPFISSIDECTYHQEHDPLGDSEE
jgi:hypothetical protein